MFDIEEKDSFILDYRGVGKELEGEGDLSKWIQEKVIEFF